jgi:hypothetical protein
MVNCRALWLFLKYGNEKDNMVIENSKYSNEEYNNNEIGDKNE